jgi:glycerol-3-phosphate acyltransferase PlsY
MHTLSLPLALAAGYLIGSLSFAVIVSRAMGLNDPRTYGSGNPGATNVLRSGSRAAAVLTLVLDALKGALPVWAVRQWGAAYGLDDAAASWVGVAAFVGHCWPVFFRFRGGKGVATAAGVLLGLNPWLGLATLIVWAAVASASRYASLAAVVAGVFAPFCQLLVWDGGPVAAAVFVMGGVLVWRHRGNVQKLLAGTESKLGQRAPVPPAQARASDKHHHKSGAES